MIQLALVTRLLSVVQQCHYISLAESKRSTYINNGILAVKKDVGDNAMAEDIFQVKITSYQHSIAS